MISIHLTCVFVFQFFDSDNDGIVTKYDLLKLPLQFKLNTTKEKQICRTCGLLCECKCDQSAHHQITDHKDSLSLLELPGPWDFGKYFEFKLITILVLKVIRILLDLRKVFTNLVWND